MDTYFELGYWGLFLASFLAATILPFSSEAMLSLMLLGGYDPLHCLTAATTGNFLGGMSGYWLGYIANWKWLNKFFKVKEEQLEKVIGKLNKYGSFLALFSWMPVVGDLLAIGLGLVRANVLITALLMLVGKLLRYMFIIYATQFFQNL